MLFTSACPRQRSLHRLLRFEACRGVGQTIVENHHDVGTKAVLNVHSCLRTQGVTGTVKVRLELNAIIADMAQRAEAEYLEPTAVGQYRTVPSHKGVQSTELRNRLISRAQKQVI